MRAVYQKARGFLESLSGYFAKYPGKLLFQSNPSASTAIRVEKINEFLDGKPSTTNDFDLFREFYAIKESARLVKNK